MEWERQPRRNRKLHHTVSGFAYCRISLAANRCKEIIMRRPLTFESVSKHDVRPRGDELDMGTRGRVTRITAR